MKNDVWINDNVVTNISNYHVVYVAGGLHIFIYYLGLQTTLQYLSALCPLYLGKLEHRIWIIINTDVVYGKVLTCTNATEINSIGKYIHTHTYIYIYLHTHTHTHTHTQTEWATKK
jgi:hypothetical protein